MDLALTTVQLWFLSFSCVLKAIGLSKVYLELISITPPSSSNSVISVIVKHDSNWPYQCGRSSMTYHALATRNTVSFFPDLTFSLLIFLWPYWGAYILDIFVVRGALVLKLKFCKIKIVKFSAMFDIRILLL